ncbi:MAG: hypothetical protein F4W91_01245 [Gemmatimonadetes bacterium]|nr:hypothetical protein [Gemmatimonadota bacterium]
MRSLKKLLFFAFVAMSPTLSTDESTANQVSFDSPLLVIEAKVGTQPGQFGISFAPEGGGWYYPTDFTIDTSGSIWVLDTRNDRVQKFDQNGQFKFAVTLPQHYKSIKAHPSGNVIVGNPSSSNPTLLFLNSKGEEKKTISVPGGGGSDFGIDKSGQILYSVAGNLTILNESGETIRVIPNASRLLKNANFYANYLIAGSSRNATGTFQKFDDTRGKMDDRTAFTPEKTSSLSSQALAIAIFPFGKNEVFVRWLINKNPRKEFITLNTLQGNVLSTPPNCPIDSFPDKPYGSFLFRVDKDGNFYQMEIILPGPQEEHLSWNYPPSSSVTFLRIWKWNRTK